MRSGDHIEYTIGIKSIVLIFKGHGDVSQLKISGKLSPKIVVIIPGQRLSWQYHHRRAEIWRVVQGEAGIITSPNDEEGALRILQVGDTITLKQGERHRLIGLWMTGLLLRKYGNIQIVITPLMNTISCVFKMILVGDFFSNKIKKNTAIKNREYHES
jgi:hypothetical protein